MDDDEGTGVISVSVNVPVNADSLSESEAAVLNALATNPNLVREQLAETLGKSLAM